MRNILKPFRDLLDRYNLLPKFAEDTIFLMLIALGIIYFFDPIAQQEIFKTLLPSEKATLIVAAGALFTVYTAFFTRFKTEAQKHYMLWFAIIINFVVGVTVIEALNSQELSLIWYIFPSLNIATFILTIIFWYTNLYSTSRLSTKSLSYEKIFYGSIALFIIYHILKLIPDMSWQVIFSSTIAYATYFNESVTNYLPKIFPQRNQKVELTMKLIDRSTIYSLSQINSFGLLGSTLLITTSDTTERTEVPSGGFNNLDAYISDFVRQHFRDKDVAIATLGHYDSKQRWWGKTKSYPAIIIDVFLAGESERYEFCLIINNETGEYVIGGKGLIYMNKLPSNLS